MEVRQQFLGDGARQSGAPQVRVVGLATVTRSTLQNAGSMARLVSITDGLSAHAPQPKPACGTDMALAGPHFQSMAP